MNILTLRGMSTQNVINGQGGIGLTSQYDKLREDIATLLLTKKGSVIGNPTYGSTLHLHLFNNITESEINLISDEIIEILQNNYNFILNAKVEAEISVDTLTLKIMYDTTNINLSTKLEFNIPLNSEGGIEI